MNKTCRKCNVDKAIDLFYKCEDSKDGYGVWCKECHSQYNKIHKPIYKEKKRIEELDEEYKLKIKKQEKELIKLLIIQNNQNIEYDDNEYEMEKQCTYCKVLKPLDEFCNSKGFKDGKNSRCRICANKINIEWKRNNKDKIRRNQDLKHYREKYGDDCYKYMEVKDNVDMMEECIKNGTECEHLGLSMDLFKKWIEFNWYLDMIWENRNKDWNILSVNSFADVRDDYLKWYNLIPVSLYDSRNGYKHLKENINDKIERFKFLYLEDRIFK